MCRYCNTITMHHASEGQASICVETECYGRVSKWASQLKTILVAKWEVPVSKRERLPKRVVTQSYRSSKFGLDTYSVVSSANESISLSHDFQISLTYMR